MKIILGDVNNQIFDLKKQITYLKKVIRKDIPVWQKKEYISVLKDNEKELKRLIIHKKRNKS